jgi:hypothetical protein
MNHPEMTDHGEHAATARQLPFSDQEWSELQAQDVHGGKMVVGLMVSIFTMGLLLYTGVYLAVR